MTTTSIDTAAAARILDFTQHIMKESKESWFKDNNDDIALIVQRAQTTLHERNDALDNASSDGMNKLDADQMQYALSILERLLAEELAATHPTQQMMTQARQQAFSAFPLRSKVRENLSALSIDALIACVFNERVTVLSGLARMKAKEVQRRNDQIEAVTHLRTMIMGGQPTEAEEGKTAKLVIIAHSSDDMVKLHLAAKLAQFDLAPYIMEDKVSRVETVNRIKITLPYGIYQQLNTALTAHTDKHTTLLTGDQLSLTEYKKQIDQAWEFMSHYSKRHHDTLHSIISNMR